MHGKTTNAYIILVLKLEGTDHSEDRCMHTYEDNIKIDVR